MKRLHRRNLNYDLNYRLIFHHDKNIDPDSIKYDFLYSLIAEKLWAKEAEDLGVTNTDKYNFIFKPLEDMFVRDALLKLKLKIKFCFPR